MPAISQGQRDTYCMIRSCPCICSLCKTSIRNGIKHAFIRKLFTPEKYQMLQSLLIRQDTVQSYMRTPAIISNLCRQSKKSMDLPSKRSQNGCTRGISTSAIRIFKPVSRDLYNDTLIPS